MTTAVLDTNVLVSGFVSRDSPTGRILLAWRNGEFQLVVSEPILTEMARALGGAYFQRRLTPEQIADDIALLRRKATVASITAYVQGVATHPEDDLILATAESASAGYLVTGDKELLELRAYHGTAIVSPRAFLHLLESAPR